VIEPEDCTCPECGGSLGELGTDEAEVLEAKTVTFTVKRYIRPKKRCLKCAGIVQAPAPSRPIEKSFAGASLLALILTCYLPTRTMSDDKGASRVRSMNSDGDGAEPAESPDIVLCGARARSGRQGAGLRA